MKKQTESTNLVRPIPIVNVNYVLTTKIKSLLKLMKDYLILKPLPKWHQVIRVRCSLISNNPQSTQTTPNQDHRGQSTNK